MKAVLAGRADREPAPAASAGEWPLARPFAIGGVEIANRVLQAPLAGIANWAFRTQSRRHGAGATVSEMIASHGIVHRNRKTLDMLAMAPGEAPMGVQVFGADPAVMAEAARVVEAAGADFVDINMGCPVGKICKTGAGASLLGDLELAERVVGAMVDAVRIPVTVKMRRGLTPADARPAEAARRMEAAGAAAICFHPRAAAEEYGGTADHAVTAEVVAAVGVPVIASGDIATAARAAEVQAATGCAAVAIGRGALGNPWAFAAIARGGPLHRPDRDELLHEIERFAEDVTAALGPRRACGYMRKFYPWYLAGTPVARADMHRMLTAETVDEALDIMRDVAPVPA
jgi:nifR3 family TIM-barrel protein